MVGNPTQSTLDQATITAIVNGYYKDLFSVLGPHRIADTLAIRVFEPNATAITAIFNEEQFSFTQLHPAGFFELKIENGQLKSENYQLEIAYSSGTTVTRFDPYAFPSTFGELDRYLLGQGSDLRVYDKLGAHLLEIDGIAGTRFAVWAPNAQRVSVVGDFNEWDGRRHPMRFHEGSGIWELFIPEIGQGELYKYEIKTFYKGFAVQKSDPVGFYGEVRPKTASIVWNIDTYQWHDHEWMNQRARANIHQSPMSVYELHLGSWQRDADGEFLSYDELAQRLIPYVKEMGFTHIELLPVAEHPFDGSWGYQVTGYFAPTSRFGTPNDFMRFVDACHQAGIGVLLDWVPAHFPKDGHGLGFFDGTYLYEHADPRKGEHPDWGTLIFNFDRNEVRQFLIGNALFWLEKYHIDGLRVDAVASMLYLDFSRQEGQWVPNIYGGRENIGAIRFLREFNEKVHAAFPDVLTIAEESTSWPGVTHSTSEGGLGFDLKWNMGWMHDSLQYMSSDPLFRSYHHGTITFSMHYAFSEKFMLPFSHDEVVHLKKSMLDKMPGDVWQKFANLRALYGYMFSHPGKKLLFMGCEFGQWGEWSEARSLDWQHIEAGNPHQQLQTYVRDLNHLYCSETALHIDDNSWDGFQWIEVQDAMHSVLAYLRRDPITRESMLIVCNFTPVVRPNYRLGIPEAGEYVEILNSDAETYGGSGVVNDGAVASEEASWRGQPQSILLTLPPLGVVFLKSAD